MAIIFLLVLLVVSTVVSVVLCGWGLMASCAIYNRILAGDASGNSGEDDAGVSVVDDQAAAVEVSGDDNNPYATPSVFAKSPNAGIAGVPNFSFVNACGVSFLLMLARSAIVASTVMVGGWPFDGGLASGTLGTGLGLGAFVAHFFVTTLLLQLLLPTSLGKSLAVAGFFHAMLILVGVIAAVCVLPLVWLQFG